MKAPNSLRVAKLIRTRALKTSIQLRKKKTLNKKQRNWLDLPRDVTINIFMKVGVVDLLHSVQKVCSLWRNTAKEPQIFKCIDMRNHVHVFGGHDYFQEYDKMVREALSRCGDGELVEFSMEYFGTDEHIRLAIQKSKSKLRCLRLVSTDRNIKDDTLIEIVKENPMLEEINLCRCSFQAETIGVIGDSCPQLKSFHLESRGPYLQNACTVDLYNKEAYAIALNMPQLRRLRLFGNQVNNKGLLVILGKCPHLEYLDLPQCFNPGFERSFLSEMSR